MLTESLDKPIGLQEAMTTSGSNILCAALSPLLKQRCVQPLLTPIDYYLLYCD